MGGNLEFKILGSLQLRINSKLTIINAVKHRIMLASFLLRFNQVVTVDELTERLWGDRPVRTARETIQTYVLRLRRILGSPDRLVNVSGGYQLNLDREELDLCRFRDLVARAQETPELDSQAGLLSQGLALWRGRALLDVPSELIQTVDAVPLEEERLDALERWFDVELERGRHAEVIRDLQVIAKELPFRERFHGQLMLALYRSGRQADAFDVYQRLRTMLADQLGVDPNSELQVLYQRILIGDLDSGAMAPSETVTVKAALADDGQSVDTKRMPQELPLKPGGFVGRDEECAEIVDVLNASSTSCVPLVVVSGLPGVGKTALAVNVAHSVRQRYPDGQLYADLGGYSSGSALEPEQALARFLLSLGVSPYQVSGNRNEMVNQYRSLLADKRVLVVLDNVGSPAQVRPLLPSSPGCAVLMTSRDDLRGLTALQGARLLELGVLSGDQSPVLLANIIGVERASREMSAVAELVELCGHLPLALRIAAANLAVRRTWSIASYVDELRQGNRLAALAIEGDGEAAIYAAFQMSYETINTEVARVFRLLGLIPGLDFTVDAVAALANVSTTRAAVLMDQLAASSLISRGGDGRFCMHDLLRLYAVERCRVDDEPSEMDDARRRLLTFYLRIVDAAADVLFPVWVRLPRPERGPSESVPVFEDATTAVSRMDVDCLNVCAAAIDAVNNGLDDLGWAMAEALRSYLFTSGRYRADGLMACRAALHAAIERGQHYAQAALHNTIGVVSLRHAELDQALSHFQAGLRAIDEAGGSVSWRARALVSLGNAHHALGRLDESAEYINEGLRLAGEADNRPVSRYALLNLGFVELHRGNLDRAVHTLYKMIALCSDTDREVVAEVEARNFVGEALLRQGRCAAAIEEFTTALDLHRRSSITPYEANVLANLSTAYLVLGDDRQGLEYARLSRTAARKSGARDQEVSALTALAWVQQVGGNLAAADRNYERALTLCTEIGHPRLEIGALIGMADNKRRSGQHDTARERARQAVELSEGTGFQTFRTQALCVLAHVELDAGNLKTAQLHARAAARLGERTGALLDQARAWCLLSRSQRRLAQPDQAAHSWWRAVDRLAAASLPPEAELSQLVAADSPELTQLADQENDSPGPVPDTPATRRRWPVTRRSRVRAMITVDGDVLCEKSLDE